MNRHFVSILPLCAALAGLSAADVLYPFGTAKGDDLMQPPWEHGFTETTYPLPWTVRFYGEPVTEIRMSYHGLLSFNDKYSTIDHQKFPLDSEYGLVALFWDDHEYYTGGNLLYRRVVTNHAQKAQISADISTYFPCESSFTASYIFLATWHEVFPYGFYDPNEYCYYYPSYTYCPFGHHDEEPNTYQVAVAIDSNRMFVIFNYAEIGWIANIGDNDKAVVGFNHGDGVHGYRHPASSSSDLTDLPTTSNVGIPGRFAYRVDTNIMSDIPCDSGPTCQLSSSLETFSGDVIYPSVDSDKESVTLVEMSDVDDPCRFRLNVRRWAESGDYFLRRVDFAFGIDRNKPGRYLKSFRLFPNPDNALLIDYRSGSRTVESIDLSTPFSAIYYWYGYPWDRTYDHVYLYYENGRYKIVSAACSWRLEYKPDIKTVTIETGSSGDYEGECVD